MKENKQSSREMGDTFKCTNICVIGVLEERRERKEQKKYSKK